jgi:hypothetical protein
MDERELPIGMPFLLAELTVDLKIYLFSTDLQQLNDDFDLQDRPFRQCVFVVEFISDL